VCDVSNNQGDAAKLAKRESGAELEVESVKDTRFQGRRGFIGNCVVH
jgi:hypothetical protein